VGDTMVTAIALGLVVLILLIWINVLMFRKRSRAKKGRVEGQDVVVTKVEPKAEPPQESKNSENPLGETLEVVQDHRPGMARKVFERPDFPFVLKTTSVPAFRQDDWIQCFRELTHDRRVLGWMAFAGDSLGASDREYEQGFVEVLRAYWRTAEKLRREVGMSQIRQTSIVADEGNVWFLTTREDTWFALFVDGNTDVKDIANQLEGVVGEA
jgi:hypothetical protein